MIGEGADEGDGVGFGVGVGKAEPDSAGANVAGGVFEFRESLVGEKLGDVVRDVGEVFDIHLNVLGEVVLGFDFAHVAFLLIFLFAFLRKTALAKDAGDGVVTGREIVGVLEPARAETGRLLAALDDAGFHLRTGLVGAGVGGVGAIHEGRARAIGFITPAPESDGFDVAAEFARGGFVAVGKGVLN